MKKLILILMIAGFITGCNNIQEWKSTVKKDLILKIETTTLMYRSDTSFTLGTKGEGDYTIIKASVQ